MLAISLTGISLRVMAGLVGRGALLEVIFAWQHKCHAIDAVARGLHNRCGHRNLGALPLHGWRRRLNFRCERVVAGDVVEQLHEPVARVLTPIPNPPLLMFRRLDRLRSGDIRCLLRCATPHILAFLVRSYRPLR